MRPGTTKTSHFHGFMKNIRTRECFGNAVTSLCIKRAIGNALRWLTITIASHFLEAWGRLTITLISNLAKYHMSIA